MPSSLGPLPGLNRSTGEVKRTGMTFSPRCTLSVLVLPEIAGADPAFQPTSDKLRCKLDPAGSSMKAKSFATNPLFVLAISASQYLISQATAQLVPGIDGPVKEGDPCQFGLRVETKLRTESESAATVGKHGACPSVKAVQAALHRRCQDCNCRSAQSCASRSTGFDRGGVCHLPCLC